MLKKFESSDIFVNRIKTYPKVRVFTYSGSMYYNNSAVSQDGVELFKFLTQPEFPYPDDCALLAENGYFLINEDNYYLINDNCGTVENVLLTEEGEPLITEDNLNLLNE